MERSYTVKEIDDLRKACKNKWLWGYYNGPRCVETFDSNGNIIKLNPSCSYNQQDLDKGVEELVRTHMLAGHTAQDLLDSEK